MSAERAPNCRVGGSRRKAFFAADGERNMSCLSGLFFSVFFLFLACFPVATEGFLFLEVPGSGVEVSGWESLRDRRFSGDFSDVDCVAI